jgi:23S rRNA pseudouridine955/2504/2580 synthase
MSSTGKTPKSGALAADSVNYVTVDAEHAGQRLDNYLLRLARGVPKSHVYRIVRSGEVRVNRARASADQRVQAGDELRIPPLRVAQNEARRANAASAPPAMPPVLFEDEGLLAVDKPAGVAAHGGSGIAFGLIERVRAARGNPVFLELAHRLDRETSGVLLLAKTRRALTRLHAAMREGEIDKRYLTLVAGRWHNDRQHVKMPLTKYVTGGGERRVSVDPEGQAAHTVFNRLERFVAAGFEFSLLEAELHTGRTHQIRVHLAHLGFPIVGDDKYGDFDLNKRIARGEFGVPLRRMFLHAHSVALVHPVTGEPLRIEAPLARECDDFLRAQRALEKNR